MFSQLINIEFQTSLPNYSSQIEYSDQC